MSEEIAKKIEEAKKVLLEEQKAREDLCLKEVLDCLEKHGCTIKHIMQVVAK